MSLHEPLGPAAGIPLETHVEELRRRCEAIARLQGCPTHYLEEVRLFRSYAAERGLLRLPGDFPELNRPPDDEGNEHQVWFQPGADAYLKVTWPDFFGLQVLFRQDEDDRASPVAYLERWHLHNQLFGDAVRFLGALLVDGRLRLVIQQQAIQGSPATLEQIDRFFTTHGWQRFTVGGEVAYFDPGRKLAISDTHRGNLILMEDGMLAPIDLRIQPLQGALLDYVIKACRC